MSFTRAPSRPSHRRPGRAVLSGVCASALLALAPPPAMAQATLSPLGLFGPASASDQGLVDFLLPYSPYLFDLVVSVSRSVVEVTYASRAYDPITRDFVVSGLKVGREGVDVSVDRIRVDGSSALYQGIAIDTRNIPMKPEAREALKKLGSETVRGDVVTSVAIDAPSATYDFDIKADFENIGALAIAAKVAGFHILVPLNDYTEEFATPPMDGEMPAEPTPPNDAPVVVGKLIKASVAYDDAGLTSTGFDIAAEAQNMATDELRGAVSTMLTPMISSLFEALPGGASDALKTRAAGWSTTMQSYLADPHHIEISFSPAEPFDLSQIKPGVQLDEAMILALNPDVSDVAYEKAALIDPDSDAAADDEMSLAARLVDGVGMPQDVGRGIALALADVAAGKDGAADTLAHGIVRDPASVTDDTAQSAYAVLLVAKARGIAVPDQAIKAIGGRLTPQQVVTAEGDALTQWRDTDAGAGEMSREGDAIAARDWGALRDLALDFYEGGTVPRNLTRAYTFAQVAAAGGDHIAVSLRDDLLAALRDKRLSFDDGAARDEAVTIWQTIVTASNETPADGTGAPATDEPAAPDEPATDAPQTDEPAPAAQ